MLQKVELESTLRNMLPQLATLNFVARQVGHKRGNTRNNVLQLAMQHFARHFEEKCCPYYRTFTMDLALSYFFHAWFKCKFPRKIAIYRR